MRRRISDRNILPGMRLFNEYKKLESLFSDTLCIGVLAAYGVKRPPSLTLERYLNDFVFSGWFLRGTAVSFYNMRDELGLDKGTILRGFNTDVFIDFIQLCLNCMLRIESELNKHSSPFYISDKHLINNIVHNCNSILESLHYTFDIDKNPGEIYVLTENNIATAVSDNNKDIDFSLVEYRRHDLKGDLKRKGEILCTLYKKLESVEKKFKGTTYQKLASDTTFLFNKTGIRHWVEQDTFASKTFLEMDPATLEKWYDNTYDLFLSCMVISSYLDTKNEIDKLKKIDN